MTVADIIRERERDAEMQRRIAFGIHCRKFIADHGMSISHFAVATVVDEDGMKRGTGSVSGILNGTARLTDAMRSVWAQILRVPEAELLALYDKPIPPGAQFMPAKERKAALAAQMAPPETRWTPPDPPPASEDQFSLVVSQDGRASLRLNLLDIPMKTAMRAMASLTRIGILDTGEAPGDD
jgi:hypothetical protein